jgi:hypothetical protein
LEISEDSFERITDEGVLIYRSIASVTLLGLNVEFLSGVAFETVCVVAVLLCTTLFDDAFTIILYFF